MPDRPVTDDEAAGGARAPGRERGGRACSRRDALGALATAGAAALAGCSLPSLTGGVQPLWLHRFEAAATAGPPAATADHVFLGAQDRRLHGFTADGDRVARYETGGPIDSRPAVPDAGGPVHVHSTDGDLYAVGLEGDERWHREGRPEHRWLGRHGSLLVGSNDLTDTVTGYDATDGTRRFQRPSSEFSTPTFTDAACVFPASGAAGSGRLVALSPTTGDVLWESTPREGYPYAREADDRLVTVQGSVVRVRDAGTGTVEWRTAVDGEVTSHFGPPVWVGDAVYVRVARRDRADELVALDREDGTERWRRATGYELETVTATTDRVFAASTVDDPDGGVVIGLDAFAPDGTREWQTTTDIPTGGTIHALGRSGGLLYAASDVALGAYDPASGSRRWRYDPDSYNIAVSATDTELYVSHASTGALARLPTS